MPWFKVDDGLAFNAKFIALPLSAAGLWVRAGAWCAQQLTDGKIPAGVVAAMGATDTETGALEDAGLWDKTRAGWRFHDWTDYQPTAETVRAERDAAAKRMREKRARWKGTAPSGTDERSGDVRPNTSRTSSERADEVREKFEDPDPTHPPPPPSPLPSPSPSPSQPTLDGGAGGASGKPEEVPADAGRAMKGSRLPESFEITDPMLTWAQEKAPHAGPSDHEAFCDYWRGVPGAKGRKTDWFATWRNWMRRASEDRERRGRTTQPNRTGPDERAAGVAHLAAQLQAQLDARGAHQTQLGA